MGAKAPFSVCHTFPIGTSPTEPGPSLTRLLLRTFLNQKDTFILKHFPNHKISDYQPLFVLFQMNMMKKLPVLKMARCI